MYKVAMIIWFFTSTQCNMIDRQTLHPPAMGELVLATYLHSTCSPYCLILFQKLNLVAGFVGQYCGLECHIYKSFHVVAYCYYFVIMSGGSWEHLHAPSYFLTDWHSWNCVIRSIIKSTIFNFSLTSCIDLCFVCLLVF